MALHLVSKCKIGDEAGEKILNFLKRDDVSKKVILFGESGIGKTWMARKICELGSFYIVFWLNLNKGFDDDMSLYEDIAFQLSIFLEDEDSEDDDDSDEDHSEDEEERKNLDLMRLKDKIQKKLGKKMLKRRGILLVLDDAGSVTSEEKVIKDLYLAEFLAHSGPLKILLTKRKREEDSIEKTHLLATDASNVQSDYGEIEPNVHEIKPLDEYVDSKIKSHATNELPDFHAIEILRENFTDDYLMSLFESLIQDGLLESLEKAWRRNSRDLKQLIVKMSMHLPAAVVVLAKSLRCIASELPLRLSPRQEELFNRAFHSSFPPDHNPALHLAYELLKTHDSRKNPIVDCFWHSLSFFEHCGCVSYQELIAHWILEGYFDPVRSVSKAYKDGHNILMELLNRGFLKIQEENVVMPEVALNNLIDLRRRGLFGRFRIGLAKICGSVRTKGLGKISLVDDTVEAVRGTRKGAITTTVLVSGNRLRRETPGKYFEKLKDLEVLGLFEPTLDPFLSKIKELKKLRVLVIRDCDLLESVEELKDLRGLHALEVSGASSLKEISDGFFKALSELKSLHLSGLKITSSPSSISELKELHYLIIRDCPLLEDLPDIQELEQLEVVDISGARGLQTCFDRLKGEKKNESKNKNFYLLKKLQFLDFSESQIERLPMFQDSAVAEKLHSMTRLLLRNCRKLRKLPNLKPLSGLQILDLSGTTSLVKMFEECFEDKKELKTLDLSRTNLSELATTIEELSSLTVLLLKEATNLETIPNIQKLTNLEVIDVSGSTKLQKIEGSFEDMYYLCEVNLSGTKVEILPESLPKESNIHCLKRITLADGRRFEGKDWDEVKKAMSSETSKDVSSSDAVVKSHENESGEIGDIQPNYTEEGDCSKERLLEVPIERDSYKNALLSFESASPQEVMEIKETNELDGKTLANAEAVSFVDCSSKRLVSIFNKFESVKGCWIRFSMDTKDLFLGVAEQHFESLETLSITNLPSLETISCGGSLKNLKNLSVDCCPKIKTLLLQMPSSLQVLHLSFCERLEEVVEGVELSAYTKLTWKVWNCPNFKGNSKASVEGA